jgi:hypothetical protein
MPLRAKEFAFSSVTGGGSIFLGLSFFSANGNVHLWLYGTDYDIAAWDKGDSAVIRC